MVCLTASVSPNVTRQTFTVEFCHFNQVKVVKKEEVIAAAVRLIS